MAKNEKTPKARYAFIGLILAGLACVSSGLVGLIKGLVAMQMYTPKTPGNLTLALQISVALIIVGLAAYALMTPDSVRRFFSGRQARYGSNSLIMIVAFLGILFAANYLVFNYPPKTWDLTEDKSHTLAPETLQALATLPNKVTAVAFFTANSDSIAADKLLLNFKTNSQGKFDYRFVDPDTDPVAARQAGITGDGKVLLMMGDQKEIASYADESELTRTLIRLISPNSRVVYFLQGHGEGSIDGGSTPSLSIAKSTLESKNYIVNPLNLLATNKIPEDALAIIIAGPKKPLALQEVSLLKKYVDGGGALIVMEDPLQFTEFGTSPDPLAEYLATDWGITLNNDVIIDVSNQQPLQAVSSSYSNDSPITQNLSANYVVILPNARTLSITSQPDGVVQTPLILTSDQSWGESNFTSAQGNQIQYDEGQDLLGPLNMAIAAENSTVNSRVVVFGNSIFATDDGFDAYGNGNIFVNSVDWAAEQDNLINITPRTPVERTFVPPSSLTFVLILIGSIFVIPGLVVVAGISSWISRRRKG